MPVRYFRVDSREQKRASEQPDQRHAADWMSKLYKQQSNHHAVRLAIEPLVIHIDTVTPQK